MVYKTTFIYALIDPITGHVRYIGKSNNPVKRFSNHLCLTNKKTKKLTWIKSLYLRGMAPELLIIDEVDYVDWQFWEMHYISLYRCFGFNLTNGTNGGDGVNSGPRGKMKLETREKIRLLKLNMSDEYRKKLSLSRIGKRPSERTLIKLRESHLGQKNENLRVPVIQLDLSGNFIKEFESVAEAARQVAGKCSANPNLVRCLKSDKRTFHGYKWRYKFPKSINNSNY